MSEPVLDCTFTGSPEDPLDEGARRYQCRNAERNCRDDKRSAPSVPEDAPDRQLATLYEDASS
jgi:hypothetical protein